MASFRSIAGHPTYVLGGGGRPLVVIPGLSDAFQPPRDSTLARVALEHYYYRGFVDDYTVYVVSRPRGLEPGTSTRDMAAGYADVIERIGRPAHVEGLSMGGLIGQYLAADYPGLVERFVCAVSGVRLSDDGLEIVARWRDMAADGDLLGVTVDSLPVTYGDSLRATAYRVLLAVAGSRFVPTDDAKEVVVQAQACLDHDAAGVLGDVEAPTLVVGGADDPLFPPAILRETADAIPGARLEVLADAAHGAFEQRKRTYDGLVRAFLDPGSDATL